MLIDTHAHLDYPDFANDFDDVLSRAREKGVERILTIGTGIESSRQAIALAERYDSIYAVVGVHPTNVEEAGLDFLHELRKLAHHPKVVAIGEAGLDYHRLPSSLQSEGTSAMDALLAGTAEGTEDFIMDGAYKAAQAEAFQMQLDLAVEVGLNMVIHQRDSWEDTLNILRPYTGKLKTVFHCFGGTSDQAAELIEMGHLVSFTGIITFKNAAIVRETAASLPEGSFMVETDCPYLAPAPHRGKRCEPWHTRLVAEKLAEIRGTTFEAIAEHTSETAESFFRFGTF